MKRLLIASLLLAFLAPIQAQTIIGNQIAVKVSTASYGATANALLSLPDDYHTTTGNYPLIIFLHGLGEKGSSVTDLKRQITQGLPKVIAGGAKMEAVNPVDGKLYKFIVLSPQHHAWTMTAEQLEYMIKTLPNTWRIDMDRIYITGLSAGGQGTIQAITYTQDLSNKIAAVVPMSPAHPGEAPMKNFRFAKESRTAAWFFAGRDAGDNTYRLNSLRYNDSLNKYNPGGSKVTIHPGGHCCWADYYNPSYRENGMNIYEWMLQFKKGDTIPTVPEPPVPPVDTVKYIQILHDPAKVFKIIVIDKDGTVTSIDSTSTTSGELKISTQ